MADTSISGFYINFILVGIVMIGGVILLQEFYSNQNQVPSSDLILFNNTFNNYDKINDKVTSIAQSFTQAPSNILAQLGTFGYVLNILWNVVINIPLLILDSNQFVFQSIAALTWYFGIPPLLVGFIILLLLAGILFGIISLFFRMRV